MSRIEWSRTVYGSLQGKVNGLSLFTVATSVVRSQGGAYSVTTALPGYKHKAAETEPEAQQLCERMLVGFVNKIGATFETPQDGA